MLPIDNGKGRMRAKNAPPASDPYGEGYIPDAFTKPPGALGRLIPRLEVKTDYRNTKRKFTNLG